MDKDDKHRWRWVCLLLAKFFHGEICTGKH